MKPRSGLDILIDRACGVPDEPTHDERDQLLRFAAMIGEQVGGFAAGFCGATGGKESLCIQASVDFALMVVRSRFDEQKYLTGGAVANGGDEVARRRARR